MLEENRRDLNGPLRTAIVGNTAGGVEKSPEGGAKATGSAGFRGGGVVDL